MLRYRVRFIRTRYLLSCDTFYGQINSLQLQRDPWFDYLNVGCPVGDVLLNKTAIDELTC